MDTVFDMLESITEVSFFASSNQPAQPAGSILLAAEEVPDTITIDRASVVVKTPWHLFDEVLDLLVSFNWPDGWCVHTL